jgi:threonine/homoserine/homoserine lactone efflux protein
LWRSLQGPVFSSWSTNVSRGNTEGLASSVALGLGGLVHVFAGAIGISALIMPSAEAVTLLELSWIALYIEYFVKGSLSTRVQFQGLA